MIRKQIPNIITLMNLLCGILAIVQLLYFDNKIMCSVFIIAGAVFDFFDGMTARILGVSSPIGKQLDSLSDVVTFGVAPSLLAVTLLNPITIYYAGYEDVRTVYKELNYIAFIPLLMAMMSSYRLAKFNLDERQTSSFIGLPTPANALLWLSIPLLSLQKNMQWLYQIMTSGYFIIPVSLIMSLLLVSEIPMFSLKFKNLKFRDNKLRFIFLRISLILLIILWLGAIPMIILLYIILSIVNNILNKKSNEISSSN